MVTVHLRFYAELNDHLPKERQAVAFPVAVDDHAPVRTVIETAGIPAAEVDLILVNGRSAGLDHRLHDGDRVSVYPVFESFDISPLLRVRERPLRTPRFVLDVHLGKLASYLRLLGFDVLYSPEYNDDELMSISLHEQRTLLSKDRRLIRHPSLTRAYMVRAHKPREQAVEVLERFDLYSSFRPFTRCLACNTLLRHVGKEDIAGRLPPRVREIFDEFYLCSFCDRVYWKGSHFQGMKIWIDGLQKRDGEEGRPSPCIPT